MIGIQVKLENAQRVDNTFKKVAQKTIQTKRRTKRIQMLGGGAGL